MAIQWVGRDIVCLSTDTKPTNVPVNTKAFETNTGATYRFNGTAWIIESGGGGGGGGFSAGGAIFKSGNGTTTVFTIAHGLTSIPDVYFALPTNTAARGDISYSVDATNITLTYPIAPASGTNNLSYVWGAGYTNVALSTFTASSATTLTNKNVSGETNTLPFLGQPTQSYSIYKSGTTIKARNNKTGVIDYSAGSEILSVVLASIISNISPAGTPTSIELGEGDFYINVPFIALDSTRVGNIKIKGQGPGITNILLQTGATRGFDIEGAVAVGKALVSNASQALQTVTLSTANAATFAVGDYVLLRTDKIWATATSAVARQGEIHKIRAIDTGTGVITFHETIMDTYVTTDNAVLAKITMLQNITLEDLKISPVPSGYTGQTQALLYCRWIDNLQLKNVEVDDCTIANGTNIHVVSCINSNLDVITRQTGNYPFVELPGVGQYGVCISLACQHITLKVSASGRWRHVVTGGGINTNMENAGIPRDITVTGTAESAMSNVWDWHADGDGIVFQNCNVSASGSVDDDGVHNTGGIGVRCKNVTITGCNLRMLTHSAISINELASNSTISGNTIHQLRRYNNLTNGVGIRLSNNITGTVITGNTLFDTTSANFGILGDGGNNDTVITGNAFISFAPLRFADSVDVLVSGNRFKNGANRAIWMTGTCDRWVITGNNATGSAASTLVGAGNVVANNINL
jgi:hypothetical protein